MGRKGNGQKKSVCKKGAAAAVMTVLILLCGCGIMEKEEEIRVMRYGEETVLEETGIAVVLRGDLVSENNIFVAYQSENKSSLSFGVSGIRYDEFYVSEGDEVKKGQLLAKLECDDYLEQVNGAKYDLERLDIESKQLEQDFINYGMPKRDYERKKADYANQRLVLTQRIEELSVYVEERYIYADIDGVVEDMAVIDSSELSEEGKVIFELSGGEKKFKGNTADERGLVVSDIYTLTAGNETYEVVLEEISREEYGDAKLTFTAVGGEEITAERGVVSYVVDEAEDVLYIPREAVSVRGEHYYVYYFNDRGLREAKEISVSGLYGDYYVVAEGLAEGEEIICD